MKCPFVAPHRAEAAKGEPNYQLVLVLAPSPLRLPRPKPALVEIFSPKKPVNMSYDDVEIEDMEWSDEIQAFTYPCPCGDLFQITKAELKIGEEIARCPSCSLYITVVYNPEDFQDYEPSQTLGASKGAPAVKVA